MLTAADLTAIRSAANASLVDTCLIKRATSTSDGVGGYTSTWTTTATVACRVAPARSPAELHLAERVAAVQGWTITLPYNTDVLPTDRLMVGSRTFEVIGRLAAETYETARRVVCVEIL
ncbi:MAG: head-tail adaptor protein [Anaerolineae bacterium]|jgi:head-tail adaptor|nr:head-tail adaptor protein [Anaerolineae bacterium]